MLSISTWWATIPFPEQILWTIAISASAVLLIQIVLMFIGGDLSDLDSDGDPDTTVESDSGIHFQFLSLKNFVAFFAMFGWTGIICLRSGLPFGWTAVISIAVGIVTMTLMASLMYGLYKLSEDGSIHFSEAIGTSGTVYLTIPAKRSGYGQVQVNLNGLRTLEAMTDNETEIKTGQLIEVIDVASSILIVKVQ